MHPQNILSNIDKHSDSAILILPTPGCNDSWSWKDTKNSLSPREWNSVWKSFAIFCLVWTDTEMPVRINLLLPHCTQHPSHMVGLPNYNFPLPEDPFIILISCWVWSQILRPSLLGCLFNHPHPYRIVSARISVMGDGACLQNLCFDLCRSAFQKNPAWELPVTAPFSKGNWTFGFSFCMFGFDCAAVTECGDLAWWPLCGGGKSLCPS